MIENTRDFKIYFLKLILISIIISLLSVSLTINLSKTSFSNSEPKSKVVQTDFLTKTNHIIESNTNLINFAIKLNKLLQTKSSSINKEDQIIELDNVLIELSKRLHKEVQIKGQLECEKSSNDVSKSGGWCSRISGLNSTNHMMDTGLAIELSAFLKNKVVASFGDGPGAYKLKMTELKQVVSYDAFDGAPYAESTTDNRVQYLDLSVPIYHLKKYDWILSLEVAEHIPAQFESIYIDNLVKHAKEGIILSWAKEGQDGHSHVNNKNAHYVIELMKSKNFSHDWKNSDNFKNKSSFDWFRNNINVFRRI